MGVISIMPDNKELTIISTQPRAYIDDTGQPIQGYAVKVEIDSLNEVHEVLVPNIVPATVKAAVKRFVDNRKALMTLFDDDEDEG